MSITTTPYERPGVQLFYNSDAFVRWVVREKVNPSSQGDWRAEKIKEFIDRHSAGDRRSIDEVCKALALPASVRQARRLFKTLVGMSFRKYAQMRRLAFAARQLQASEEPVKVIAMEAGYRRTAEFTRSFRELFRLSPLEFRRIWSRRECAAYGVSTGADFIKTVEVLDVDRKQVLQDSLPSCLKVQLQFSRDKQGFYYSQEAVDIPRPHYRAAYWHEFGTNRERDLEIFFAGEGPNVHLTSLFRSPDGHFLGYLVMNVGDSAELEFYIQDLHHGKRANKLIDHLRPIFYPFFLGDRLLALTDRDAPNRRIVEIDLREPGPRHWVDVVPTTEHSINDFAISGNNIVVAYVHNGSTRIEVFDSSGRWMARVPCPALGSGQPLWQHSKNTTITYKFSSFTCPPTILSYHMHSGEQKTWAKCNVAFDPSFIDVDHVHYKSKDGIEIPMFLVARKAQRSSGPLPTFLTAYGGFGISRTPQFNAYSTFLIEQGCLFALANVRGGGEFGGEWHHAATRHNRQIAFDDFIAAAEWLIANGRAAPRRIAIGGGSNAGLLVGAALTQRPDLFRVVICLGPVLDMLRYHLFDRTHMLVDEYGTADRQDDFVCLHAYSPYHRVENGVAYPAVMFVSGDQDTCCNPMHARKMTARLQAATSSQQPILLDYKPTWGHASVQPLSRRIEALTDRLAFICYELGIEIKGRK